MNKTVLYVIIGVLIGIIIGGVIFFVLNGRFGTKTETTNKTPMPTATPSQTPSPTPSETLSEQPNQTKFNEYFTEIYLAKLPVGQTINPLTSMPTRTKIFTTGDQFCANMTLKKAIPNGSFSFSTYDVGTKQEITPKTLFFQELKVGGTSGCENLTYPSGKYERKFYVDDVLVAVLPFEVK